MSSCWGEIDNFKTKKVVTDKDIEELFLADRYAITYFLRLRIILSIKIEVIEISLI